MAIWIPRIRTIGVRLSQDEYAVLERFCQESGARSMSDVAREAIASFIRDASWKSALASKASRNAPQMRRLEEKVEQLTAELAELRVSSLPHAQGGREKSGRSAKS